MSFEFSFLQGGNKRISMASAPCGYIHLSCCLPILKSLDVCSTRILTRQESNGIFVSIIKTIFSYNFYITQPIQLSYDITQLAGQTECKIFRYLGRQLYIKHSGRQIFGYYCRQIFEYLDHQGCQVSSHIWQGRQIVRYLDIQADR